MNKKIQNTYDELVGRGINVESVDEENIKIMGPLKLYNLDAYKLWTIIREFGTTFGISNDVNKLEEINITIGHACPDEVVKDYLDMEDSLEDSISDGFN